MMNFEKPYEEYSKYEAEIELWGLSSRTDMEVVVIRPPLVYGAHVQDLKR